jgi:hypothetical protein
MSNECLVAACKDVLVVPLDKFPSEYVQSCLLPLLGLNSETCGYDCSRINRFSLVSIGENPVHIASLKVLDDLHSATVVTTLKSWTLVGIPFSDIQVNIIFKTWFD